MSEVNLENLSKKELIGIIKNIKEEYPDIKIKLLVDKNLILIYDKINNKQNQIENQIENQNKTSDKKSTQCVDFNHLNFII